MTDDGVFQLRMNALMRPIYEDLGKYPRGRLEDEEVALAAAEGLILIDGCVIIRSHIGKPGTST